MKSLAGSVLSTTGFVVLLGFVVDGVGTFYVLWS